MKTLLLAALLSSTAIHGSANANEWIEHPSLMAVARVATTAGKCIASEVQRQAPSLMVEVFPISASWISTAQDPRFLEIRLMGADANRELQNYHLQLDAGERSRWRGDMAGSEAIVYGTRRMKAIAQLWDVRTHPAQIVAAIDLSACRSVISTR